ncbi:unnamed protein product [Rotaria socialis]
MLRKEFVPRLNVLRNQEGTMLQTNDDIKRRWTQYCSSLYKNPGGEDGMVKELKDISPPENEDPHDILYSEVQATINSLKRNKNPGSDVVAVEMLQAGGEPLSRQIHKFCNKAWHKGTTPEEWGKSILVPIPKKGDLSNCSNYRTISLINHTGKVLLIVLVNRLKTHLDPYLSEEQAGFRKDRSTVHQILTLRLLAEKAKRQGKKIYSCFIDFQKAFDTIKHKIIWAMLKSYGVDAKMITLLQKIYEKSQSAVRIGRDNGEWFRTDVGTRQGDPLSPLLFIAYLERVMDQVRQNTCGINISGILINNLRFADDIDLIDEDVSSLQRQLELTKTAAEQAGLILNINKTKTMCSSLDTITSNPQFIEQLDELIKQQSKQILLIKTHDLNSKCCSGDIVAVQLLCACVDSSSHTHVQNNNSLNNDLSDGARQQNFNIDKRMNSDSGDQQSNEIIMNNNQDSQNEHVVSSDVLTNNTVTSVSSVHTPPRLFMSPASASSSIISLKSVDMNPTTDQMSNTKLNNVSHLLDQNILSPRKKHDHTVITDDQKAVLIYLQRQSSDSFVFTCDIKKIQQIEREKATVISQNDMDKLKKLQKNNLQKKSSSKNKTPQTVDDLNPEERKRNLEWTLILDSYIENSNDYCVFLYERHHFTNRTAINNTNKFFMSADAHCKFKLCTCRLHAILYENSRLKINYFGKIVHEIGEVHARPMRGSRREELQKFTMLGATPAALYLQQLKLMSTANKEAGNRNVVGSSRSVIRKISSEGNVKLRRDDDLEKSLRQLKSEQTEKLFPGEQIPGYLQEISIDPLRLICFTAGGIAAYHKFASTIPLSWDATGGIIVNRKKRIFYYELTMSSLDKGGSSLPIAVMLSASHGTMDIIHWMNCFIEKYKQVYGYTNPFPKPPVIHSDRALVFLLAGIQVFNGDETMDRYIERCWRIIQRVATKRDLEITVVHSCLGHFMKNVKVNASKVLGKKQVSFGMWLMALLVNSNTLDEMMIIWRNICIVLLSTNQNDQFKISLSTLSKMADQMNGDPEKTNFVLQNVSVTTKGHCSSTINADNDDDVTHDVEIDEDDRFCIESSFKKLFITIYQENKDLLKSYDAPEWQHLSANPLFSAAYLSRILKLYMPTAPIWSNLLLGTFAQRYGYSSNLVVPPCSCHFGRTTGKSESQMRVLKEAILSKKIYSRIDEVVSKLGDTIEAVEIQFADFILIKRTKNRVLPAKKQKKIEEPWNKRTKIIKPTGVYTSMKPSMNLVAMVNTRLLGQNDDSNLDVGQLPSFVRIENAGNTCWFNSIIQMLLASGHIVETIRKFHIIDKDLVPDKIFILSNILKTFISTSISSHTNGRKEIIDKNFIKDHFGYLRWAGFNIETYKKYCVFEFFQAAIIPMLLFYNIDFQYVLEKSMQCSSCQEITSLTRETWSFLLVSQTANEETFDNITANLFGPVLDMQICDKCLKNDLHPTSISILNCPKHLFVHLDPHVTNDTKRPKLTTHVDFGNILSNNGICTRSYSRYTLQSFIVVDGTDNKAHNMTYARSKLGWYCLNDTNITLVKSLSIFGDQAKHQSVMMVHFTRPSDIDVFSIALWNVFTNFSPINISLTTNLSLNDAVNYFAKYHLIENNPLH